MQPLIEAIESFFNARFDRAEPLWDLACFDGYAHWRLMFLPEDGFLKITAGEEQMPSAFPTVEVEGRYSDAASVSPLVGDGIALMLQPAGTRDSRNWVVITKTPKGRFSLSLTVGEEVGV